MSKRKPAVELDPGLLDQVADWQSEHAVRSRGQAVAMLITKGLELSAAESAGFDLTPVVRQQLEAAAAKLDALIAEKDNAHA
jgi:hypothetical protein